MFPNMVIKIPEYVLSEPIGQETVLLDLNSGCYFGLNAVASSLWRLLGQEKSLDQAVAALQEEYDVDSDTLKADLDCILRELSSRNMIHLGPDGSSGA